MMGYSLPTSTGKPDFFDPPCFLDVQTGGFQAAACLVQNELRHQLQIGFITPLTISHKPRYPCNLFSAIYRGPITLLITVDGAHDLWVGIRLLGRFLRKKYLEVYSKKKQKGHLSQGLNSLYWGWSSNL